MKKITTLLFLLITLPFYAQWTEQTSGVTAVLNDVYCITQDIVVVVGNSGTILKTTDGGTNWVQKTSGTTQSLMKVQFINPNVGYAAGYNGTLLKTTDAGENWLPLTIGQQSYHGGLSCLSENIFFVCSDSKIKKTTDGGTTFTILNTPPSQSIENIQFLTELIGYAYSYDTLLKTIDGGNTWSVLSNDHITSIFFLNENVGFIHIINYGIYKTIDGGQNLSLVSYSEGQAQDLFSLDENILWEIDHVQNLCNCEYYCVTKRDLTQSPENQENKICNLAPAFDKILNAIHFANPTTGYLVGSLSYSGSFGPPISRGAIFKNTTGNNPPLAIVTVNKKDSLKISPNPASDHITITFQDNTAQPFSVEIKDALAKTVFSKSYQSDNQTSVNTENLSNGIYFITIKTQDKTQTKKLIIN